MRIAVNRKALEANKRIGDFTDHLPPIIVEDDNGEIATLFAYNLDQRKDWHVIYDPDNPWSALDMEFTVWIESLD